MAYEIDFSIATSAQIEMALCKKIGDIRLVRNMTQAELAEKAGISLRTIRRMEKGEGVSLDTFIRVLIALGIQQNLEGLLPDPSVRPIERINRGGRERQRASSHTPETEKKPWSWGDEIEDNQRD